MSDKELLGLALAGLVAIGTRVVWLVVRYVREERAKVAEPTQEAVLYD